MGVISRTLRDEYKKNVDLTIYLLGTFLAISNYQQLHGYLIDNQIGDTTMKIIEYQIRKGDIIKDEMLKLLESSSKPEEKVAGIMEGKRETEAELKKYQGIIKKQDKMLCCRTFAMMMIILILI